MEPSTFLLACLVYLGSIAPNNTYTTCQIEQKAVQNQNSIIQIQNNSQMSNFVVTNYTDEAMQVDVQPGVCPE